MIEDARIRMSLERLLGRTFTDQQWSLIVSQGYEEAVTSRARSIEDVAAELRALTEAAVAEAGTRQELGPGQPRDSLTWEQMERLVLGQALAAGQPGSRSAPPPLPSRGPRVERLIAGRKRWWRRWLMGIGVSVAALVVGLVVAVAVGGLQCGSGGDESAADDLSAGSASTGTEAWALPDLPTTTTLPPVTTTEPMPHVYEAELYGTAVVPAVVSEAGGHIELVFSDDGESVHYVLSLEDIEGLTVARLRVAPPGEKGEQIYTVYPGPEKNGLFTGVAADASFGADDFVGEFEGQTMADFKELLDQGLVYVIVGSKENRNGEIRGQIQ